MNRLNLQNQPKRVLKKPRFDLRSRAKKQREPTSDIQAKEQLFVLCVFQYILERVGREENAKPPRSREAPPLRGITQRKDRRYSREGRTVRFSLKIRLARPGAEGHCHSSTQAGYHAGTYHATTLCITQGLCMNRPHIFSRIFF